MRCNEKKSYFGEYALLALLTILSAVLRFYKLGEWSYFIDELHTWDDTIQSQSHAIPLIKLLYPNNRQIFWFLTKLSLDMFGVNEISLRLFPCIFGVLTIPLLYFPFRYFFDRRVAFLALFLIAVSPWHIYMSQMARWYTILVLLVIFSLISFYIFIENGSITYLFLYFMLFFLAFSLHLTGGFVPIIAMAYVLMMILFPQFRGQNIKTKQLIIALIIHFGISIILLPRLVSFMISWKASEVLHGSWGSDFALKALYHITPSIAFFTLIGLIILIKNKNHKGLFWIIYCLSPFVFLGVASMLFQMNVSARYLFFTLPGILLLSSYLCIYLMDNIRVNNKIIVLATIAAIAIPSLQYDYLYFTSEYGYRYRMKEVFRFLKKNMNENDLLFAPVMYNSHDREFYFKSMTYMENLNTRDEQLITAGSPDDLNSHKRIWIIMNGHMPKNPQGLWGWVADKTRLSAEFKTRRGIKDQTIKIYLYTPRLSIPAG